jgi:hypothetical protein
MRRSRFNAASPKPFVAQVRAAGGGFKSAAPPCARLPLRIKGVRFDFLCAAYVCKTAHAALARRIKLGCSTPSFGVCPCGAAGGTLNHSSL